MNFKDLPLEERIRIHNKQREKSPHTISLLLTPDTRSTGFNDAFPWSLPKESTVGEVIQFLKKKVKCEMLFLVTETQSSPTPDVLLSDLYHEMKNEDGVLYLAYGGEELMEELTVGALISLKMIRSVRPDSWEPHFKLLRLVFTISESHHSVLNKLKSKMTPPLMDNLCVLFMGCSTRADRKWIFQLRHGFPDFANLDFHDILAHVVALFVKDTDQEELKLTLDMSHLLEQSMEQIGNVNPTRLHGNISVAFTDELAVGDGVFAHWFLLVCEKLFHPEQKLFIHSPDDPRRFSPIRLSSPREDQISSFKFAGRFFALALKFEIQLGILLDPIFFRNLGALPVVLEHIGMSDESEMKMCQRLLNMSEQEISEGGMGLSFTVEIDKQEIPLCPDGENTLLTFENRDLYVRLRVQKLFVDLVQPQVQSFREGFADILHDSDDFFKTMSLEDIDALLKGEDDISIEDWRAHTLYEDFEETDRTITWFWQILAGFDKETQRNFLTFWTSIKYLPVRGFSSLLRKLTIAKYKSQDRRSARFPQSQTCSSLLILREYHEWEFEVMKSQLTYAASYEEVLTGFGHL